MTPVGFVHTHSTKRYATACARTHAKVLVYDTRIELNWELINSALLFLFRSILFPKPKERKKRKKENNAYLSQQWKVVHFNHSTALVGSELDLAPVAGRDKGALHARGHSLLYTAPAAIYQFPLFVTAAATAALWPLAFMITALALVERRPVPV